MQAANAARVTDQTAGRAAEALNASLMAENAELRRHTAGVQEARAAGGGMATSDVATSADDTQRYSPSLDAKLDARLVQYCPNWHWFDALR